MVAAVRGRTSFRLTGIRYCHGREQSLLGVAVGSVLHPCVHQPVLIVVIAATLTLLGTEIEPL